MPNNLKDKTILCNGNYKQMYHNTCKQIEDNIWNPRLRWYCRKVILHVCETVHVLVLHHSSTYTHYSMYLLLTVLVCNSYCIFSSNNHFSSYNPSACTQLTIYVDIPTSQHRVPVTLRNVLRHFSKT